MVLLAGQPLINYVLRTSLTWGRADRIIVSTEDSDIASYSKEFGAIVAGRPHHLCGDSIPVASVIGNLLEQDTTWPDVIILLQPTSPFVLPQHLWTAYQAFQIDGKYVNSFETITKVPHNYHEYNQREISKDRSFWLHPKERLSGYNKQTKPDRYMFGNIIAFRPEKFMKSRNLFEYPRKYAIIPRAYAHDVDDEFDLAIAEALIEKGLVNLELQT